MRPRKLKIFKAFSVLLHPRDFHLVVKRCEETWREKKNIYSKIRSLINANNLLHSRLANNTHEPESISIRAFHFVTHHSGEEIYVSHLYFFTNI